MTDETKDPTSDELNAGSPVEQQIKEAAEKLHIEANVLRKISPEEIQYLLDHCPFLQMVDIDPADENKEVEFITAESGWTIHNYGDAMSSSPGQLLFGGGNFRVHMLDDDDDDDGGGGGSILNPGKGTIYNQAVMTAFEMVALAFQNSEKSWGGIKIIDGHERMKRAAWIKASQLGISVEGYTPTEDDIRVQKRVDLSSNEFEKLRQSVKHSKSR